MLSNVTSHKIGALKKELKANPWILPLWSSFYRQLGLNIFLQFLKTFIRYVPIFLLSIWTLQSSIPFILKVLKPNGLLIFRDYSVNDMAMFRFKKGSKLGSRHYLRQDGTSTYFFTEEEMKKLCQSVGFEVEVNEVIERRTINKKEDIDVIRLFLQGKYRKKWFGLIIFYITDQF